MKQKLFKSCDVTEFMSFKDCQHSLLVMTEKFKESIDKGNAFGALLTDLSKAFDCIDDTLLLAKLSAFGVSPLSLKLLYSYISDLANQNQRKF